METPKSWMSDYEPFSKNKEGHIRTSYGVRHLYLFGEDYDTEDGTCVRDYIHVADLASAHILAMEYLANGGESDVFNLGTGNGFSVQQIIDATKAVTGIDFAVKKGTRRAGDPGTLVASSEKIQKKLGWKPIHSDVKTIIEDAWRWHQSHPRGYDDK